MSIRLINAAWESSVADPTAMLVLVCLADQANDEGGCWPKKESLCWKTRLSASGLRQVLTRLADEGHISVEHGGGRARANRYLIHPQTPHQKRGFRNGVSETGFLVAKNPARGGENPAPGAPFLGDIGGKTTKNHQGTTNRTIIGGSNRSAAADDAPSSGAVDLADSGTAENVPQPPPVRHADAFAAFWRTYPRKVGKPKAEAAFRRLKLHERIEQVLVGLRRWTMSDEWSDPRYVPHPTTWLNRGGWEDEPMNSGHRPGTVGKKEEGGLLIDPALPEPEWDWRGLYAGLYGCEPAASLRWYQVPAAGRREIERERAKKERGAA